MDATAPARARANSSYGSLRDGLLGIGIFSASLPATRFAMTGFEPVFLTAARAVIAGIAAGGMLVVLRQPRPARGDLSALAATALGVVVGFPLLSALALRTITAAHGAVFAGLLPLATALFATLRAGERPSRAFWALSGLGSLVTVGYALSRSAGVSVNGPSLVGDGLMLGAILVCGLGYAEGGRLARRLGGWQVIAWANVLALPVTLPLALACWPDDLADASATAWVGLAYVGLFSMLIGFVFWYRALARGGIARVGQLQLLQPFLGMALAALLLGDRVEPGMLVAALAVVACVAGARRLA